MQNIDEAHMNTIIRKAASRWKFATVYEDLLQVGRIAYWQNCEEDDPEYLMIVKVRRKMIDAWRKMTNGRSKYRFSYVELPEEKSSKHPFFLEEDYFTANCLNLPKRHTEIVSAIANGMAKNEVAEMIGVTPSRISQLLAEVRRMVDNQ